MTILLLASDAGPDRTGTRTDSMVAASIDTHTGDVILLSLPRNLQNVPMPPGPLREQWPNGFPDLLNGVYQFVTNQPHLLAGARDRGAAAIKSVVSYILGIPIDYYAMVDLAGLRRVHRRHRRRDGRRHPAAADRRPDSRTAPGCRRSATSSRASSTSTAPRRSGTRGPAGTAPTTTGCSGSAA